MPEPGTAVLIAPNPLGSLAPTTPVDVGDGAGLPPGLVGNQQLVALGSYEAASSHVTGKRRCW